MYIYTLLYKYKIINKYIYKYEYINMNIDMNEGFKEGVWGVCMWGQEGALLFNCHLSFVICKRVTIYQPHPGSSFLRRGADFASRKRLV